MIAEPDSGTAHASKFPLFFSYLEMFFRKLLLGSLSASLIIYFFYQQFTEVNISSTEVKEYYEHLFIF